ncbi:FecCD family ABC transporter permease [Salininema proteolyticum]|uniref:FecCD family ABC transporter permease n=1 Tax=Salininema proteolyticum TaxID=1607685 RepID=A0ABV8TUV3_9ACTN
MSTVHSPSPSHVVKRIGSLSVRSHRRSLIAGLAATAVLALLGLYALSAGDTGKGLGRTLAILVGDGTAAEDFIVLELRLPRLLTAVFVGAALGCAGSLFQTLTRNPLGSPDLLGITSGATTGALVCIVFGISTAPLAIAGFAGAAAVGVGVLFTLLLRGIDSTTGYRLILIGLGCSAMFTGLNGYLLTRTQDVVVASKAVYWMTGDLSGSDWGQAATVGFAAVAGLVAALLLSRSLDGVRYGTHTATGLGVNVALTTRSALGLACLLTAAAVAVAGPLAFVALSAPHIARTLCRGDRPNLLVSAVFGAAIVVVADTAAQHAFVDRQLPTGAVTGAIGGLYLMWLLAAHRKKGTRL